MATPESLAIEAGVKRLPSSAVQPVMTLMFLENWPLLTSSEGVAGMKLSSMTGKLGRSLTLQEDQMTQHSLYIKTKRRVPNFRIGECDVK